MTPASYNITVPQSATYTLHFQFKDSTGTPLNMAGYNVEAQIWSSPNKINKLADFAVTWDDRSIGKVTLSLSASASAAVKTVGVWDLLVINPDGTKDYWVRGRAALAVGYTT